MVMSNYHKILNYVRNLNVNEEVIELMAVLLKNDKRYY